MSNLKPEETYSFRVIAYNDVGPGESSAPLKITTKPDRKRRTRTHTHGPGGMLTQPVCVSPVQVPGRVESLRLVALSPSSVQVSWEPPSHPNGPVLWYRLLWTESPSGKEQVSAAGVRRGRRPPTGPRANGGCLVERGGERSHLQDGRTQQVHRVQRSRASAQSLRSRSCHRGDQRHHPLRR